jgi:hypothetical protein
MQLQLPSGNVVVLVRFEGPDAVCEYARCSKEKGEIFFSRGWLSRFCVVLSVR